jgi:sugar lactone lactonase YvrE
MKSKNFAPAIRAVALAGIVVFSVGCGGGSSGSSSGAPGGGDALRSATTATFHVDVASGMVTVVPNKPTSRAIFAGSAITFNSSLLLDQPSTVGLKTLSVSLTNNFGLPIGVTPTGNPTGLKVIFGNFSNVNAFTDVRPKTNVSTFAGNGNAVETNGPLLLSAFNGPTGIVAAGNGVFYVADKAGNTIRKISGGNVSILAGSSAAGTINGQGAFAKFNFPFGIALNPIDGSLIVTDLLGNTVRRVTTDGRVTTVAGTGAATSVDGSGSSATLYGPTGVAFDASGTLYVSEYFGQHIRKIVLTGSNPSVASSYTVSTIAGSGAAGGADGNGNAASFNAPTGLTVSPEDGGIYVVDQGNNSIRRVTTAGEVATIAGNGTASSTDGLGYNATFNSPRGIVYSRGALFVTDRLGNLVRQLTLSTGASPSVAYNWNVSSLAGSGGTGTTDGAGNVANIYQPQGIAVDPSGNLYVPDFNNRIRKIIPSEGFFPVGTAGGSAATEQVQLSNPDGIIPSSASPSGVPYIAYSGSVESGASTTAKNWNFTIPSGVTAFEFTITVEADTTALTPPEGGTGGATNNVSVRTLTGGGTHLGYLNGPLSVARFNGPEYLATDDAGNVYTADQYNAVIRRISVDGMVSTVAGTGTPGFADGNGSTAAFSYPSGIAVSRDGFTIYVADTVNNRVRRIALTGGDPSSQFSWTVSTIAGNGTAGGTYAVSAGNTATLNSPVGLAIDGGGNIYVSESAGNKIRRITLNGGDPSLAASWRVQILAGDNSAAVGATGTTDSPSGTSARFQSPNSLACDRAGNVYVADASNHRVRMVTVDGAVTTLAGGVSGDSPSSSYADGLAGAAHFQSPTGIAVDSSGLVFVAESSGNRIRSITPGGKVTTVAGTGSGGTLDGLGSAATFNNPTALAVTKSGVLYVGSVNDNGIRIVERIISAGTR